MLRIGCELQRLLNWLFVLPELIVLSGSAAIENFEIDMLEADDQRRCARLLAACARGLIGDETAALHWLYPDLPR